MNMSKRLISLGFNLAFLWIFLLWSASPLLTIARGDDDADAKSKSSIKVLMIGNSFSRDTATYLGGLAEASGKKVVLLNCYHGSCSLEGHARGIEATEKDPTSPAARIYTHEGSLGGGASLPNEFNLKEALKSDKWDFVTIQQFSLISADQKTYEPWAHEIIEYIHKYAPQAEILVHETWAYREDTPEFKGGKGQKEMYEGLKAAYTKLANDYHLRMIPIGDAFQAARATERWTFHYPDPNYNYTNPEKGTLPDQKGSLNMGWYWRGVPTDKTPALDTHHLSPAGKYLGSCVLYEVLFGEDVSDVHFCPNELKPDDVESLRKIAHETAQAQKKNDPEPKPAASSDSGDSM